jgi:hypothetical protein
VAFGAMAARFREARHRTVMKPKRKKPRLFDPGEMPAKYRRLLDKDPEYCMATVEAAEEVYAEKKAGMTPAKRRQTRALIRKLRSEMSHKAASIMIRRLAGEILRRDGKECSKPDARLFIRKALATFRFAEELLRHVPAADRLDLLAVIDLFRNTCRGALHALQSGRPFSLGKDFPVDGRLPRRSRKQPRRYA